MAYLLKRIAEEADLDDAQRRTDMGIVQGARKKFNLPYEPLTMKEEALRIAAHLEWNIVIDEDRNAVIAEFQAYEAAKRDAVKGALKKLRKVLVAQDHKKQERLQMEILEGTDSAKNKAEAIAAMSAASKLPGRAGSEDIPTSPRDILVLARERLAMPSKNVHKLKFDALLRETQQVCFSYGIELQIPDSPRSEGASTARSGASSEGGDGSVAPSSTVVSSVNSVTMARNRLQDRIDGAIGTSNLDVIRGVLYDAKHFDGDLGYERPLEHLRDYARDLGLSSSESESEEDSSALLGSDSSDDDAEDDEGDDVVGSPQSLTAISEAGEASPQGQLPAVGPKGLDNISKAYDRLVAALAATLTYVQGTGREQKDPEKTLRKSLLIVLRSEYEFDQLKQRGLRPVAMGSVSVHGKEDRTRTTWVMAIRGVKFYCGVDTKPELQEMLNKIEAAYRLEMDRKQSIKERKKEIQSEKQYPRFQRAMVNLLQLPEFPDEQEFRMGLRKSVEATLTDIYSQPHPNPERFDALLADATETVAEALRAVHSTFVESKQRHAAVNSEGFQAAVAELVRQLPSTGSIDEDDEYQEQIEKQLRLAVIDSEPKRFEKLLANVAPVVRTALEKTRETFSAALKQIEADAERKKMNAGWLDSLWKGIAPDKEVDDATTRELRRIKKALARGRRGAMIDKQAIAEEEEARRNAEAQAKAAKDEEDDSDDDIVRRRAPAAQKEEKMVTMEEAYELISAKLQINDDIVALKPIEILQKARDRLALPVIELTEQNLESETRMVCLGLGILIEDDDYRERKKAQSYKSGRGRRAAMQAIGMIQKGTKWQAGGMSAKDGKVWWCSNCNYKNAPRWRCSMCGHRNNEMATQATPAIYSNRTHVEPSAERRALNSMQEMFSSVKARSDAARKAAEEEEAVAQAAAEAAAVEEEARDREAALAVEREEKAHREWLAKAAERSALAVAEAARIEEERRATLAERVQRVMEEDLETNRERRKLQLQRLEKKMAMRDDASLLKHGGNVTAPQLGMMNAASETGTLLPLNNTAGTFLPGEAKKTQQVSFELTAEAAADAGHTTQDELLTTAQMKDDIADLSALAGGYEAEAQKAEARAAAATTSSPGDSETQHPHNGQHALADVHDPLGLQLATIQTLQRSRPGLAETNWEGQVRQRRLQTPEDVRFMRSTLSLAGMVRPQQDDEGSDSDDDAHAGAQRRWRSPPRTRGGQQPRHIEREQGFDTSPVRESPAKQKIRRDASGLDGDRGGGGGGSKPKSGLVAYRAMTSENRRVLQKRTRRYGHLVTDYNAQDRQGATLLHMTV
jgi:hypothetical protein